MEVVAAAAVAVAVAVVVFKFSSGRGLVVSGSGGSGWGLWEVRYQGGFVSGFSGALWRSSLKPPLLTPS